MKSDIYHRLLRWIVENTRPPRHVQIVPTNKCNIACIFCWRTWELKESKEKHLVDRISDRRYYLIIREICESSKLRPKSITITGGGEPLLKKELVCKMVKKIKEHSIHCEIVTNGILLEERTIKKFILYGLDNLCISINASSPRLADFLYGKKNCFKKVITTMKLLKKWKKILNSERPVIANTIVITKHNYREICSMVEQAHRYGVTTLNVRWVSEPYCEGRPGPLCMPSNKYDEFCEIFKRAQKTAKETGVSLVSDFTLEDLKKFLDLSKESSKVLFTTVSNQISLSELLSREDSFELLCKMGICTFPFYELFIDACGYASGCGTLASAGGVDHEVADSVLENSMAEIWYGPRMNNLRVLMLMRKFTRICKTCNVINIAKMGREWLKKYP
jgi:MoaA/NifB/PqqE/SkfB family radical SAM enzyme